MSKVLTSIAERENGLKYIYRLESPARYIMGWQVRVYGTEHSKFFPDKKHGGRRKALDAAIAFRDAITGKESA